jgi:hypothetical protein
MKWSNSKKHYSFGPLSVFWFLAALPIWFLILLMFLTLSALKRLLSLLLRRPKTLNKQREDSISSVRAPRIPEPISQIEMDQVLDVGSDAWEIAAMRRYRSYLETCLDYSYSDYDDPLA